MCKTRPKLARAREILDSIPGIGPRVAEVIMAEIGIEMEPLSLQRCRASGQLGRDLSRQQSHWRQTPVGPHAQRQHLFACGPGASSLGCDLEEELLLEQSVSIDWSSDWAARKPWWRWPIRCW